MLYNLEIINDNSRNDQELELSKLWCYSSHYKSSDYEDEQKCGGAILLRRLAEKQLIPVENTQIGRLADIKNLGAEIRFMPNRTFAKTMELQRLLNMNGAYLRIDGRAGKRTAQAYYSITNEYLPGDPDNTNA